MKNLLPLLLLLLLVTVAHAQKRTYEYDELQRLKTTNYWNNGAVVSKVIYTYDAVGNRETKTITNANVPVPPDLSVINASRSPSGNLSAGASINLFGSIKNTGDAINTPFKLKFYLSTDQTFDVTDIQLSAIVNYTTIGTTEIAFSQVMNLPPAEQGQRFLLYFVDADNTISNESNEANNVVAVPITIIPACSGISVSVATTNANGSSNNGTATATATGGTSPYIYLWNNSATTATISNLTPNTYTVAVTDANGCQGNGSGVVGQTATCNISLSAAITNVSCGASDGAINLTVANATNPVSFTWSNSATTEDISTLAQGTYFVTVTDGAGCTASGSYVVGNIPSTAWSVTSTVGLPANTSTSAGTFGRINDKFLFIANYRDFKELSFANEQITAVNPSNFSPNTPNYYISKISVSNDIQPSSNDKATISLIDVYTSGNYNVLYDMGSTYYMNSSNTVFGGSFSNGPPIFKSLAKGASGNMGLDDNAKLWKYGSNFNLVSTENLPTGISYQDNAVEYSRALQVYTVFSTSTGWVKVYNESGTLLQTITSSQLIYLRGVKCTVNKIMLYGYTSSGLAKLEIYSGNNYQLLDTVDLVNIPSSSSAAIDNDYFPNLLFLPTQNKIEIVDLVNKVSLQTIELGSSNYGVAYEKNSQKLMAVTNSGFKFLQKQATGVSISSQVTNTAYGQSTGSINLTVSGGTATYAWSTGATTKDISNLAEGTYSVTVTPSGGGCSVVRSFQIKTNTAPPAPTITANPASGTIVSGSGSSVTLTANACTGLVKWSTGASGSSIVVSPTTTTSYTATCTYKNLESPNSTPFSVTVIPATSAPVISANKTSLCAGQSVVLTATNCSGTVNWSSGETGSSITKSLSQNTTFTATCTQNGNTSGNSNSISVSIIPGASLPTATLSGTQTIVQGQSATLSVALTGSSPWAITVNGTAYNSITASPKTILVSPVTTTTFTITSVSNACGAGTVSGSAVVTVNPMSAGETYSVKSGNWHDPTTWNCNCVPNNTHTVEIKQSHTVTASTGDAKLKNLKLSGGILNFQNGHKLCFGCQ